ncbi:hypothetical protein [Rhizobium rhizogenes]|uniref:hypothetical protein n=1 Tax=Rhizobium rhizogenes TaxID=359 RepID=UPI00056B2BF1|nr:hypothetical protein [Rhizobium rhizogenes]NTF83714.1 hypothetical protein [Rhizobium rhizogenes]
MNGADSNHPQSGFALVAVLGLVLVASAILVPFSISARLRALTAENALRSFRYSRIEKTLSLHVAGQLATRRKHGDIDIPQADGMSRCDLGEYSITLGVQDHAGLIDLNKAGIPLLNIGFQALGFSEENASTLALATDNYRRPDRQAERELPAELVGETGYKHAAFEDVIELQDLVALQLVSPAAIANVFTVQTGSRTLSSKAVSDAINRVLESRASGSLPLSVSTAKPPAVTIFVRLFRNQKLEASSATVFDLAGDGFAYVASIPTVPEEAETTAYFGRDLPCGDFIAEPMLTAAADALK